ncbi:hypothetical protein AMTR_s00147p00083620, partial [Amborella trichopoda]
CPPPAAPLMEVYPSAAPLSNACPPLLPRYRTCAPSPIFLLLRCLSLCLPLAKRRPLRASLRFDWGLRRYPLAFCTPSEGATLFFLFAGHVAPRGHLLSPLYSPLSFPSPTHPLVPSQGPSPSQPTCCPPLPSSGSSVGLSWSGFHVYVILRLLCLLAASLLESWWIYYRGQFSLV